MNLANLSIGKLIASGITALFVTAGVISAVTPSQPQEQAAAPTIVEVKSPKVEIKTEEKIINIPFDTEYLNDETLPEGTTKTITEGINGTKIEYYEITYENGRETSRELTKTEVTQEPTNKIIANGTYVTPLSPQQSQPQSQAPPSAATNCQNGTYVNTAGNTVCRPSSDNTGDATAICKDGTYSYSQNRRGTCSGHGGVKEWL